MKTDSLSLDQAPPLSVPGSFFVSAPLFMVLAGLWLLYYGASALQSQWSPATLGLTHLATLGLLGMTMMGALYQMTPVVAATPVPRPRLAHAVHLLLAVGGLHLVWGLASGFVAMHPPALVVLSAAILLFLGPVGLALARAPASNHTVHGMRLAVFSLGALASLGLVIAWGYALRTPPQPRASWLHLHLALALIGWVGGLLAAVSWQINPMFYLAAPVSTRWTGVVLWSTAGSVAALLGLVGALAAGIALPTGAIWVAAGPGALAVWGVHPALTLRSLAARRRKRKDASLNFWQLGMGSGLLSGALALAAILGSDPRWAVAFGWVALFGWAGAVMHGMLCRIVPFLVWFHRMSALVGVVPVPSMRKLLPDKVVRRGLWLHGGALVLGLSAIATGLDPLAWATGLALLATGLHLGLALGRTLATSAPAAPSDAPALNPRHP